MQARRLLTMARVVLDERGFVVLVGLRAERLRPEVLFDLPQAVTGVVDDRDARENTSKANRISSAPPIAAASAGAIPRNKRNWRVIEVCFY